MQAREMMRNDQRNIRNDDYVKQLVAKWSPLLEGVKDRHNRNVLAMLFENQEGHLGGLSEETLSTNVGPYQKYIFPWLRRIYPNLIANNLVSVQPMTGPRSTVFTFEWKYEDDKGAVAKNTNFLEAFNKHYSSPFIDTETVSLAIGAGVGVINDSNNSAKRKAFAWIPIQAKKSGFGTPDVQLITLTFQDGAAQVCTAQDNGAGSFVLVTGVLTSRAIGDVVGTIDYTTGVWTMDIGDGSADAKRFHTTVPIKATYWYVPEKVGFTANAKNPSMFFDIQQTTIEAVSRRLTTRWSEESIEDLRNLHGEEGEEVLVEGMTSQISMEIDREIISDLQSGAKWASSFSFAQGQMWGSAGAAGTQIQVDELGLIRSLVTSMDALGAKVHKASGRAPANWAVCSPAVGSMFKQLSSSGQFQPTPVALEGDSYGDKGANYGALKIGTLLGQYAVYQDPIQDDTKVIVGLKGSSYMHAGYVYGPYVPITATGNQEDAETFTSRKGMRTRYGKKMLRSEYYGVLTVSGLPTVT